MGKPLMRCNYCWFVVGRQPQDLEACWSPETTVASLEANPNFNWANQPAVTGCAGSIRCRFLQLVLSNSCHLRIRDQEPWAMGVLNKY